MGSHWVWSWLEYCDRNPMTVRALGLLGVVSIAWAQTPSNIKPAADTVITILRTSCVPCHSATRAAGKLALDSVEALAGGGASGAVITPGDSNRSILYKRIAATNAGLRMPPTGAPLAAEKIALIRDWIERGADGLVQRTAGLRGPVEFERDVHPILKTSCYPCHSGPQPRSGLRLDVQATAMRGGVGGVVIVPGNSGGSRLVHRIEGKGGEPQMPLGRTPLTSEQIAILRTWIDQGARWPAVRGEAPADALLEKHWSYLKPSRPAVPAVDGVGIEPDRRVRTRGVEAARPRLLRPRLEGEADPAGKPGPDRTAADTGRSGCVRRRHSPGCI